MLLRGAQYFQCASQLLLQALFVSRSFEMADIHIYHPLCIAAGAVFPPVAVSLVAIRFYVRRQQGSHIGIDDWLTVPAVESTLVDTRIVFTN